jgi:DNA-binding response OmpR family regulator
MERLNVSTEPGIDLDENAISNRKQLLVVDDDADTVFLLKQVMRIAGFNVIGALNGHEALRKVSEYEPDLVLLDLMMPKINGWEVYSRIRQMTVAPVIVISAAGNKEQVVRGLQSGFDDYITKPFSNAEVVARVQAVLRRTSKPQEDKRIIFPQIQMTIDLSTHDVTVNGEKLFLTPKEFAILSILARHAPDLVRYDQIAEAVWYSRSSDARNRTKYFVYLLRKKLEKCLPGFELIQNLDRRGYRFQTGD